MVRNAFIAALLVSTPAIAAPALAQDGRAGLVAVQPGAVSFAISRWESMSSSSMAFESSTSICFISLTDFPSIFAF